MEIEEADISAVTGRNIKLGLLDKNLSRNALALRAGIPSTTFTRKLNCPTDFTLRELGQVAEALDVKVVDLIKGAA
ncbi:putative transcriptional regulator [Arthrobacter phage vB_ArS-ArV2]|uniref:Putative transcriptional regulator n=1 Tax=Arthrobacter phage vB_ArS-ArV2 TaxID=1414742 RepID=V5R8S2_9CAUD|nr:putative transcriptional regulator [Arthrobacter phage vB_ArS-ArV2]AHB31646.1 putative transcriptional regulator [Arthrobacter phage vB_ArS-ArV2]